MKHYKIFIDESGTPSPSHRASNYYVLSGCIINVNHRDEVRIEADHIKFKYWGRTDVVFHSQEIYKNEGDFEIFKGKDDLKEEFLKDMFVFLRKSQVHVMMAIVDKEQARKRGWNNIKVIQETSSCLVHNFIVFLLSNTNYRGSIIIESAGSYKDFYYLKDFDYYLSPDCSRKNGFNHEEVRTALTSLSFVTKRNLDIEEQIADLFAYGGKCKYEKEKLKKKFEIGSYEDKIVALLDKKLMSFIQPQNNKTRKLRLYKTKSFCILPN